LQHQPVNGCGWRSVDRNAPLRRARASRHDRTRWQMNAAQQSALHVHGSRCNVRMGERE